MNEFNLNPLLTKLPRVKESQSNHDKMVEIVANDLVDKGYYVLADHIGWPLGSPPEIGGFIPDIVARGTGNDYFILEVETNDSWKSMHTVEQLRSFSKTGHPTYLILPYSSHGILQKLPISQAIAARTHLKNNFLDKVLIGECDIQNRSVRYD